jgi:predicted metal-dependent phosphoesterase TrpH
VLVILTDFHIHSNFSDGKHSIPEIIDLYGSRGFGAIAITDHLCETQTFLGKAANYLNHTLTEETFPLYLETIRTEAARAWDQYRMTVMPGVEFTRNSVSNHRSAHILALNLNQFISPDGSIEEILGAIRAKGAFSVAAHPVFTRKLEKQTFHLWDRKEELDPLFDAWEVASGPNLFPEVQASGFRMIANTDLHRFSQINAYKTLVDSARDSEAILDAIMKQKVSFHLYQDHRQAVRSRPHSIPVGIQTRDVIPVYATK